MQSDKPSGVYEATNAGIVLVVDQNFVTRKWLEQNVGAQGYTVECATDAESAVSILRLAPGLIRAVVVNAADNEGGGQATLRAIRDHDRKARIIAFAVHAGIDFRIPLAVLPLPLEQKSLAIALHLATTMGTKRPAAEAGKKKTVRPAAA